MKTKAPGKDSIHWLMFRPLFLWGALPALAQSPRVNGKIAFTSDRDGNSEIYVMDADGSNQVRLTNNSVVDDHATWSPEGTKLAFLSQRASGEFAIFQMNGDGTGKTEITLVNYQPPNNLGWDYWSMSWSPDGRQITFQDRAATGEPSIYIVNADGSSRRFLTNGVQPAWSPDGSKILFSNQPAFFFYWLFTIRPDGTGLQALPIAEDYVDTAPTWSPTGDRIVFQGWDWANWEDLVMASADGTNRQTFAYGCYDNPGGICGGANFPDWSPDGSKIVFCLDGYGYNVDPEIWVKNVTGDGLTQLTNTTGNNVNPSWQPLSPDSSPNPIDRGDFFVRQQYLDFLGREAEPAGLQFYMDILNGCHPADTECIKYTRGALSANFFRSPEFGRKGAYVASLFNIVIGQRPKTVAELNDPTKVERPHYAEFMADLATLSTPNDDPVLTDQKKDQLASAWLGRTEVLAILPSSLSNQQFVQKLESIAGVTLANESTLIAELNNGSQTRAQVLRAVAESNEVVTKFYIPNFVTMEYLGYLRRDPEDCHVSSDAESCGFIFHNRRFNTPGANPDLIENIIVRGFIESPEYRSRFLLGPWDY